MQKPHRWPAVKTCQRIGEGPMADRRSLIEGIKSATTPERQREKEFVYGDARPESPVEPAATAPRQALAARSRSPISTRIRSDFATALKRASLERQLDNIEPNTLQDILEAA